MQWIKASKRLPLHLAFWNRYDAEDCAFPVRINGKYRAAELFDNRLKGETEPKYVFSVKGIGGRDYYEEEFHLIEWLDESEPAPSPAPEYNRDENSPQGKAAIAFYNWMESASMSNAKIPLEIKWRMFADQKNAKK